MASTGFVAAASSLLVAGQPRKLALHCLAPGSVVSVHVLLCKEAYQICSTRVLQTIQALTEHNALSVPDVPFPPGWAVPGCPSTWHQVSRNTALGASQTSGPNSQAPAS